MTIATGDRRTGGPTGREPSVQTLAWNLETTSRRPQDLTPPHDLRARFMDGRDLPPLPAVTHRLMALQRDPQAGAADLASLAATEPLLAAQILRWANSARYGQREPVTELQRAIVQILGFETALHLALGLSTLAPLRTPNQGPLARDAVWRHGRHCADLVARLRDALPADTRPHRGLAQLSGLTQNIGYLVLGHLAPEALAFVGSLVQGNPRLELPVIERFAIGLDHTQLSLWLFETWTMPEPLCAVVRHHHNPAYEGPHQTLVLLNWLADQLLATTAHGLGPPPLEPPCQMLMARLGLDETRCAEALARTLSITAEEDAAPGIST